MSLLSTEIVTTSHGVFTPPPPMRWMVGLVGAGTIAAVAVLQYLGKPWPLQVFLGVALTAAVLGRAVLERRRWGALGRPHVALIEGEVLFTSNMSAPERLRIPHTEISKIVVYGPARQRIYRVLKHNGGYVEARPLWRRGVESAAVAFLERALPGDVIVEEPQTAMAQARRDGPYHGS